MSDEWMASYEQFIASNKVGLILTLLLAGMIMWDPKPVFYDIKGISYNLPSILGLIAIYCKYIEKAWLDEVSFFIV